MLILLRIKQQMNEKMIPQVEDNKRSSEDSEPNNGNANIYGKYRKGMAGKGHQAKNLEAERKRRRKLNDRLYSLRALVPNISKLDRAAILDDAISYVEELRKEADDLQIELQQHSDASTIVRKRAKIAENMKEKVQQMEAQVEVVNIDGNELFIKVLYEDKGGGFVRLVEALTSLDLQVINVNTTKRECLVSNIFIVEKRSGEIMEADRVKETLMSMV